MGDRLRPQGHLPTRQSWSVRVLQEGLPRQRHHQHCRAQQVGEDWQLVQGGQQRPQEVFKWACKEGQAIQMSG